MVSFKSTTISSIVRLFFVIQFLASMDKLSMFVVSFSMLVSIFSRFSELCSIIFCSFDVSSFRLFKVSLIGSLFSVRMELVCSNAFLSSFSICLSSAIASLIAGFCSFKKLFISSATFEPFDKIFFTSSVS